jgi:hypothetical protein
VPGDRTLSGPTLYPFQDSVAVVEEAFSLECDIDEDIGVDQNPHLSKSVFGFKGVQKGVRTRWSS